MTTHETFEIYFVLDGEDYGMRHWRAVPRVGDHIMLHPSEGSFTAEVTRVVWGVSKDRDTATPTINVMVEREPRAALTEGESRG